MGLFKQFCALFFQNDARATTSRKLYVVIYDVNDPNSEAFEESDERYYGFFADFEEMKTIFKEYRKNRTFYNVRICEVVGNFDELAATDTGAVK